MNLLDLLEIERSGIDPSSICLMRHTDRELGDYLLNPSIFNFYTSVQKRGRLSRHKYVMAFFVNASGKTVFRGMFEINVCEPLRTEHHQALFLPDGIAKKYETLCQKDEYDFYSISPTTVLASYEGRIVIDWGKGAIAWFQSFSTDKPKEVLEILPSGFFRTFDGYSSVSISRSDLEFLVRNADANPEWVVPLSRVSGIYLILDEGTGDQYIGSASGSRGIWGRWSDYFDNPSGGNALLEDKLSRDAYAHIRFRYSLLEVLPGGLLRSEVIARETLYKKMLGTRAHGLNMN